MVAAKEKGGSILIMEDEEMVSTIAIQMLEYIGYDAEVAVNGNEAIDLYRQRLEEKKPFAAVIMDLTIPNGMGGEEAVKGILALDRDAKVIVSSGYSVDPVMVDYAEYGFRAAIAKPFNLPELTKIIENLC